MLSRLSPKIKIPGTIHSVTTSLFPQVPSTLYHQCRHSSFTINLFTHSRVDASLTLVHLKHSHKVAGSTQELHDASKSTSSACTPMMSMMSSPLFDGASWEDPQGYIDEVILFTDESSVMKEPDPEKRDLKMMSTFRKGLRGEAKEWYQQLAADKRQSWPELQSGLKKRFPLRAEVVSSDSEDATADDRPSSPVRPVNQPEPSWDYMKQGTQMERQKAIKEEVFRLSPLEDSPAENPVIAKLINDGSRFEFFFNINNNLPVFPTSLTAMTGNIDPPRPENVDLLLEKIENMKTRMLCAPLPPDVARYFISRQKTKQHLFPPSKPVNINYSEEVDYFHVPWTLLYAIVQVEFSMGRPAFFNQRFLMDFLSFPPLSSQPIPESVPDGQDDCIVSSQPQLWSAHSYDLDMFHAVVYRKRQEWTRKQTQSFFTTATRLIRHEFPEKVREGIALRIRFCHPDEYPSQAMSCHSLKAAMRDRQPLSLPDFEVVRCLSLGDLSSKLMMSFADHLQSHGMGWFLSDKLISSPNKEEIYSPTGMPVNLSFGTPVPITTRRITQMLDSDVRGYGFKLHFPETICTKRKLTEDSLVDEGIHKRTRGQNGLGRKTSNTTTEKQTHEAPAAQDSGLHEENTRLRDRVSVLKVEKESLLTRTAELEVQLQTARDALRDAARDAASKQDVDTIIKERDFLLTQLEQAKERQRELIKQNEDLNGQVQKEKDNMIQALQSHITQITTMIPAYQNRN